jgi:hypothetical protein
VEFLLENLSIRRAHNAILTHDAQSHYTLSDGGVNTNNETRTSTANSLEALSSEMRKNKTDFDDTGIQSVRAQAELIPAVVFAQTGTTDSIIGTVTKVLVDFYTNPTVAKYNTVGDPKMKKINRQH